MNSKIFALFLLLKTVSIFSADYDADEARAVLGYDPRITLIKESNPLVVTSKRKTVYFHGFGGNKDAASIVKQYYGSERLAGDIITFDFADADNGSMDTSKSSLGQWNDIKTALYVLKKMHEAGEKEAGIDAHSRGGATAVNMVAVLVDQTGQYDARLSELGINQELRQALLRMLQKGHIVLECPLIDVRSVIQHSIEESSTSSSGSSSSSWLWRWFASSPSTETTIYSSAASVDYMAPLILKKYRPWAEQAIRSAEVWHDVQIPTIVHFQEEDEVLGNARNNEFYEKLSRSNGGDCTSFHLGNDGGHNSSFRSFASERNAFLKKYGASYNKTERD